jgi:hypothetical protein
VDLEPLRVTDTQGISFEVKALDLDDLGIRIFLVEGRLRIESLRQERLNIKVIKSYAIELDTK